LLLAALRDAIFLYDAPGLKPRAIFRFSLPGKWFRKTFHEKKESFMTAFIKILIRKKEFKPFPGGENENSPGF
jgi:hypothetical protein